MKTIVKSIIVAFLFMFPVAQGATTAMYFMTGPAGSYIAQNTTGTTIDQGAWNFPTPGGINFSSHGIWMAAYNLTDPGSQWMIQIMAQQNQLVTTGLFFATRWGQQDPSNSGFSWFGDGRAVNTSTSYFNVLEFSYNDATNAVEKFAVDVIQFEETGIKKDVNFYTDPSAYVSYRYNSSIGINQTPSATLMAQVIPEPSSLALAGIGAGLVLIRRKRN